MTVQWVLLYGPRELGVFIQSFRQPCARLSWSGLFSSEVLWRVRWESKQRYN